MSATAERETRVRSDIGRYGILPEWLLDAGLSARAIHLFAILAAKYSDDGVAHPGRRRLRADMGDVSLDTVDRAIVELIDKGAITVAPRRSDDGDQTSNEYTLHFGRGAQGLLALPTGGRTHAATPGQGRGHGSRTDAATVAAPMRPYPESSYPEPLDPELSRARAPALEIPSKPLTRKQIQREQHVFGREAERIWLEAAAKCGSPYVDRAALRMVHELAIKATRWATEGQVLNAIRQRLGIQSTPRRIPEWARLEAGDDAKRVHDASVRDELPNEIIEPRSSELRPIGAGVAKVLARVAS